MSHASRPAGLRRACAPVDERPARQVAARPVRRCEALGAEGLTKEQGPAMGLCVDCRVASTCTIAKPEGGVWHCADYE